MKKKFFLFLFLFGMLLVVGCSQEQDKKIAEVNGEAITQREFNQRFAIIKASYEAQQGQKFDEKKDKEIIEKIQNLTYENLVMQKLLSQVAERENIKVDEEEIESNLKYIKENKNKESNNGFDQFLADLHLTEASLRQELATEQLYWEIREKKTNQVNIGEDQANKYYVENSGQFQDQGGMQISHILVEDEKTAQVIIGKLKRGANFAVLAKEYSIDQSNKNSGGDLGTVNENSNFVDAFKEVALALQPGEITLQPVKSEFGYHVIKAGNLKAPGVIPFEQVKEQIKAQLEKDEKDQVFNQYLEQLKSNANIKDLRKK